MVEPWLRVGIWGTSDVNNYGDSLFPRIVERELSARLPGASIVAFAPYGWERVDSFDEGTPSEPLGEWSGARLDELASRVDAVIVGGGEIIHFRDELYGVHYGVGDDEMTRRAPHRYFIEGLGPDLEPDCAVFWHSVGIPFDFSDEAPGGDPTEVSEAGRVRRALDNRRYVTVRDERSHARLEAIGVTGADVVPDSAFLMDRLWPPDVLGRRRRFLVSMGWLPDTASTLVVQGNGSLVAHVGAIGAAVDKVVAGRPDLAVVVIETSRGHGDAAFADALVSVLDRAPYRVGAGVGLSDLAAVIASSAGFVGSSMHGNITAHVHGRPHLILDLADQSKLAALAETIGDPTRRATSVERLAEVMDRALSSPVSVSHLQTLQERVDAHFDRLADEVATATASPVHLEPGVEDVDRERAGRVEAGEASALRRRLVEVERERDQLERALHSRARRLRDERSRLIDRLDEQVERCERVERELADEMARRETEGDRTVEADQLRMRLEEVEAVGQAHIAALQEECRALQHHLDVVFATKTMRAVRPVRVRYQRWRQSRWWR